MPVTEAHPDDAELRVARRARLLAEMESAGVDVFVLGREANARYVAGAPRLWLAGSRPFGVGCVLVRETGAVHLLSTWDEAVPDEIPHENLYGISFNSQTFLAVLQGIDRAGTVRTVATDGLTPSSARFLPKAFPSAELVDGEPLLRRVRQVKLPDEVEAIRESVRIAELALGAAEAALAPGVTERQLTGVFLEAMAAAGVTTPSTQDVAWITSRAHPWHRAGRDVPATAGDLVAFEAGVVAGGYVGEVGRTRIVGERPGETFEAGAAGGSAGDLFARCHDLFDRLLAACGPGAPQSDLLDAYAAAGVAPPPMPVARGLGLGYDLPLVTHALPESAASQPLEEGMVLALTAFVWQEGVGAVYGQEPVVVRAAGPELLSSHPLRPFPVV